MRTETIQSLERLREIEDAWWDLLERAPASDFFLTPPWIFAWWSVFSEDRVLCTLAFWDADRLVGLFPLYWGMRGPFRVITFVGHPRLADRMDFLIDAGHEDACLRGFADWVAGRRDWDYLKLREFGALSDHPERLAAIFGEMGLGFVTGEDAICPYVRLPESPDVDAYCKEMHSTKRAKDLRRRRRRMDENADARYAVVNHIDRQTLDEMEELDALRSYRGSIGRCFFTVPLHKYFLRRLMQELGQHDYVRLVTLRIDGRLCAYDLQYLYRRRLLAYQGAFDDEMRSESPGTLVFLKTIEYGIENGCEEYDFLSGDEAYKGEWARLARTNRRLIVFRGTWRSRIVAFYQRYVKPLRRKLGAAVRLRRFIPESMRGGWDL